MEDNLRYQANSLSGQTQRAIGRSLFSGLVEGFKILVRFLREMVGMLLGR